MNSNNKLTNIAGWIVFAIAAIVYFFSVERTGSLWDCGEFITGAYKLQVVHPPGAALFLLVGRIFTLFGEFFSSDPAMISFAVNMMSGILTAFTAMFVCWSTIILGKMALVGRDAEPESDQMLALAGAGIVAGLSTAFCSSIWFSAVEGEVYAMSTFFTALTVWSALKWYNLPDEPQSDRWLIFTVYAAGLSIGVHLLSLLTFPALAMFYYFKKYKEKTVFGMIAAAAAGVGFIAFIQFFIITGIPKLWSMLELMMVNGFGLPFQSGVFPLLLLIVGLIYAAFKYAHKKGSANLHTFVMCTALVIIGFSTIGVIVIRANANTPINMNDPSDPMRLLPYLNREQYGERPLLYGPHFDAKPTKSDVQDRYGRLGDKYAYTDQKVAYVFNNKDKMFFPRIGHYEMGRPDQHRRWMGFKRGQALPSGRPGQMDNLSFLFRYQMGWMYWRYFMWNFTGRQNGQQGFEPWDKSSGHWISGINFIDNMRLDFDQSELTETMLNHKARNTYYFLPLIFGLLGVFFHMKNRGWDFVGLLALFVITGIGIIIYSNQPPNEPRERDYVLVGSFFTFCIWIGMGVLAVFHLLKKRANLSGNVAAPIAFVLALSAPLIMGFQNFDDHSRMNHSGSRDYASNFLNSCDKNAIIFTYGDNDTYPLWYAQEVENIRTDVRVVNLSLIAVDWYIDQLRRKVNDSPPIKMTIPQDKINGKMRNQIIYYNPGGTDKEMSIKQAVEFIGSDNKIGNSAQSFESFLPSRKLYIPVNKQEVIKNGVVGIEDSAKIMTTMPFNLNGKNQLLKGDVAILDILASNLWERPIYFAVTCRPDAMMGLQDYTQLEGLALKMVPIKTKGEKNYGMMGNGRVNTDAVYNNFMTKYKWGGFDKHETHIDRSYGPSVQSHRVAVLRASKELVKEGKKTKAVELIEKYFEAFPHYNFPYDYHAFFLMSNLLAADAPEVAKKHMRILAKESADNLRLFISIDDKVLKNSFETELAMAVQNRENLFKAAKTMKDEAFEKELKDIFGDIPEF